MPGSMGEKEGQLSIERGIVRQGIGDVKTKYSGRTISIDDEMLAVLLGERE
jgi:hypothetical protein